MQACFHRRKGLLPLCIAALGLLASSVVSAGDVADRYRAKMKHFIYDMPKVELPMKRPGYLNRKRKPTLTASKPGQTPMA